MRFSIWRSLNGLFLSAALLIVALWSGYALAQATEPRVALVIGNGAYRAAGVPKLANPANDARAMAQTLRELGFKVIELEDAELKAMQKAFVEFTQALPRNGAALFYYAGHGIQLKGQNYLVPVDATVDTAAAIPFETFPMEVVTDQLNDAHARVALVILDACRDSPFGRGLRGLSGGLAAIDAARGTLIAYATAPGAVASDGDSEHGLYTAELLKSMKTAGVEVEQLLRRVRAAVEERSHGKQVPWESSSLIGEFYFVPPAPPPPAPTPPPQVQQSGPDKEVVFWQSIKDSTNRADFEAYLTQYPKGAFVPLARNRLEALKLAKQEPPPAANPAAPREGLDLQQTDLAYWESVKGSGNPADFEAYVQRFPTGAFVELARLKIAALRREEEAAWSKVKDSASQGEVQAFLARYPSGANAVRAGQKLAKLGDEEELRKREQQAVEAWARIKGAEQAEVFKDFLEKYPKSRFAGDAQARLADIRHHAEAADAWRRVKDSRSPRKI